MYVLQIRTLKQSWINTTKSVKNNRIKSKSTVETIHQYEYKTKNKK